MEENFYKISNSTGLTIGKLKNRDVNVRAKIKENIVTLMHHAEVEWIKNPNNNNQTPIFSAYGDCDSLCCVRRGSFFVPFAIHCGANSFVSYGGVHWSEHYPIWASNKMILNSWSHVSLRSLLFVVLAVVNKITRNYANLISLIYFVCSV